MGESAGVPVRTTTACLMSPSNLSLAGLTSRPLSVSQIEPPSQAALLDATMEIDGVLLAGVPGAGGYDAVFAITVGDIARTLVVKEWSSRGVLSLCVSEDCNGVRHEKDDPRTGGLADRVQTLQLN